MYIFEYIEGSKVKGLNDFYGEVTYFSKRVKSRPLSPVPMARQSLHERPLPLIPLLLLPISCSYCVYLCELVLSLTKDLCPYQVKLPISTDAVKERLIVVIKGRWLFVI